MKGCIHVISGEKFTLYRVILPKYKDCLLRKNFFLAEAGFGKTELATLLPILEMQICIYEKDFFYQRGNDHLVLSVAVAGFLNGSK